MNLYSLTTKNDILKILLKLLNGNEDVSLYIYMLSKNLLDKDISNYHTNCILDNLNNNYISDIFINNNIPLLLEHKIFLIIHKIKNESINFMRTIYLLLAEININKNDNMFNLMYDNEKYNDSRIMVNRIHMLQSINVIGGYNRYSQNNNYNFMLSLEGDKFKWQLSEDKYPPSDPSIFHKIRYLNGLKDHLKYVLYDDYNMWLNEEISHIVIPSY